jgi:hypothetical protein
VFEKEVAAMTTQTKTKTPRTTTARVTTPATKTKRTATAKKAVRATKTTTPVLETSPRAMADRLRVQADLANMDARDQWHRLANELERRRGAADQAVRDLLEGGADASRTFANGVRDAVDELRAAVEAAVKALR